jgi:hypothetical protein
MMPLLLVYFINYFRTPGNRKPGKVRKGPEKWDRAAKRE